MNVLGAVTRPTADGLSLLSVGALGLAASHSSRDPSVPRLHEVVITHLLNESASTNNLLRVHVVLATSTYIITVFIPILE